jgi:hypothetical protein
MRFMPLFSILENAPTGVKTIFPKLLKTTTKLKLSLFGFTKSDKLDMDLQSPSADSGTSM